MQTAAKQHYFGSVGQVYVFPRTQFRKCKMTAIVAVRSSWGVLMAADGRMNVNRSPKGGNDHTQKIFYIIEPSRTMVYGFAGSVATGASLSSLSLDMRADFQHQVEVLSASEFESPEDYVKALASPVTAAIQEARHFPTSNGRSIGGGRKIADLIIGGCFGPILFLMLAEFSHSQGKARFRIVDYTEQYRARVYCGSEVILKAMYDPSWNPLPNSPLSQYAHILDDAPSVSEVRRFAVGYIDACRSSVGRSLDPKGCRGIGGHIHVATVKPRAGFEWIVPPKDAVIR